MCELRCVMVAVYRNCSLWELRHMGIEVLGSCGVWGLLWLPNFNSLSLWDSSRFFAFSPFSAKNHLF